MIDGGSFPALLDTNYLSTLIGACSQCNTPSEHISLLLTCGHHLCHYCAARSCIRGIQLGSVGRSPNLQCPLCQIVTPVASSVASHFDDLLASESERKKTDIKQVHGFTPSFCSASPGTLQLESPHSGKSSSPLVSLCGQCEERPRTMYCKQCDEFFCRYCAAAMHSRGQMLKHDVIPHTSAENDLASCSTTIDRFEVEDALTQSLDRAVFVKKFRTCPIHGEALQYFCLTCECDCICAECALHGDHRDHEVLNLQEGVKRLPELVGNLFREARLHVSRLACWCDHLAECQCDITQSVSYFREKLSQQCDQLRADLHAKENSAILAMTKGQDRYAQMLVIPQSEAYIYAALASIRRRRHSQSDVEALGAFSKLRSALDGHLRNYEPLAKKLAELKRQCRNESMFYSITVLKALLCGPLDLSVENPIDEQEHLCDQAKRSLDEQLAIEAECTLVSSGTSSQRISLWTLQAFDYIMPSR